MTINRKLNSLLHYQKKLAFEFGNMDRIPKEKLNEYASLGKTIILAVVGYKCEKCGSESDLTVHHLLPRKYMKFFKGNRYIIQRHYWANHGVLCKKCHAGLHRLDNETIKRMGVISKDKIEKEMKKWLKK